MVMITKFLQGVTYIFLFEFNHSECFLNRSLYYVTKVSCAQYTWKRFVIPKNYFLFMVYFWTLNVFPYGNVNCVLPVLNTSVTSTLSALAASPDRLWMFDSVQPNPFHCFPLENVQPVLLQSQLPRGCLDSIWLQRLCRSAADGVIWQRHLWWPPMSHNSLWFPVEPLVLHDIYLWEPTPDFELIVLQVGT